MGVSTASLPGTSNQGIVPRGQPPGADFAPGASSPLRVHSRMRVKALAMKRMRLSSCNFAFQPNTAGPQNMCM